jgi:hypothetical protein
MGAAVPKGKQRAIDIEERNLAAARGNRPLRTRR